MKGPAAAHSKVPGKSSNRRRPIQHPKSFHPMYHRGEFHQRKPLGGRPAPEPFPIVTGFTLQLTSAVVLPLGFYPCGSFPSWCAGGRPK